MSLPTFDLPSAKNMTIETAVSTFVPTPLYWQIMHAETNDIIFGTRGSGKTMLLRMMSFPHLVAFARHHKRAKRALYDERRYGLFIPLGIDWCVAYQDDKPETLGLFSEGVNLVSADCLLETLDHFIRSDVGDLANRSATERALAERLCQHWFRPEHGVMYSIADLRRSLLTHQAILRDTWRGRSEAPNQSELQRAGYHFRAAPVLRPLSDALRIANPLLNLPESHRWLVGLDELEDLKPNQSRAITTLIRSATDLCLKITTQPYTVDSGETLFSSEATAVDFRDFEVRRLQHDPADKDYCDLVAAILRKRVRALPKVSGAQLAGHLFGQSTFAERATLAAPDFASARRRILSSGNADSARKRVPPLAIRYLRRAADGHTKPGAYAGWDTIVRASDGNPGMFVRILNAFQLDASQDSAIPPTRQHEVLTSLASNWHEWSTALYSDGQRLHSLIEDIGSAFSAQLHDRSVHDEETPVETNRLLVDLSEIDAATAEAFRVGARHGLFVAETTDGSLRYPNARGVWRLSYALAPKFWLLLRRGRIVKFAVRQLTLAFLRATAARDWSVDGEFAPADQVELSSGTEDTEI